MADIYNPSQEETDEELQRRLMQQTSPEEALNLFKPAGEGTGTVPQIEGNAMAPMPTQPSAQEQLIRQLEAPAPEKPPIGWKRGLLGILAGAGMGMAGARPEDIKAISSRIFYGGPYTHAVKSRNELLDQLTEAAGQEQALAKEQRAEAPETLGAPQVTTLGLGQAVREPQTGTLHFEPFTMNGKPVIPGQKALNAQDIARLNAQGLTAEEDPVNPGQYKVRPLTQDEALANPVFKQKADLAEATKNWHDSQIALNQATEALRRAQNDPNSPAFKLLQQKANTAQANVMRAQAALMNAYANIYGTSPSGEPIPGAPTDLEGNPVGLSTYRETGPTTTQKNRGQFARDMLEYINTQVRPSLAQAKRSGQLGPLAGRISELKVALGNADPGFMTFATNNELLKSGTTYVHFGGRGAQMSYQEKIGRLLDPKLTPQALDASISAIERLMNIYARSGGRSIIQPPLPGENVPGQGRPNLKNMKVPKPAKEQPKPTNPNNPFGI